MILTFWGVRGSIPTPIKNIEVRDIFLNTLSKTKVKKDETPSEYRDRLKEKISKNFNPLYGGNTTSISFEFENNIIIFDAGTGIRLLGNKIMQDFGKSKKMKKTSLFLTHVHWDHIQGFPFYIPNFVPGNKMKIYGFENSWQTISEAFNSQMDNNYFPVRLKELKANLEFKDIFENEIIRIIEDKENDEYIYIENVKLNHPNGCLGYKITYKNKSVVFATDTEHYYPPQVSLINLARDCDLLIMDAQYTKEEYSGECGFSRQSWGHSTPERCLDLAKAANAKKLILTHHDPMHDTFKLDDMEKNARKYAKEIGYKYDVSFAKEDIEIKI